MRIGGSPLRVNGEDLVVQRLTVFLSCRPLAPSAGSWGSRKAPVVMASLNALAAKPVARFRV